MSSRAAYLLGVLLFLTLPSLLSAQTLPTTTPATQPSIQCSPEVQALIPLIREGERLYTDVELSYTRTDRSVGGNPDQFRLIERTGTYIHSKSRFYSDSVESCSIGKSDSSEIRTIASWDGQFHRMYLENLLKKDDRAAMVGLGLPFSSSINDLSPFSPFCMDKTRLLADHFASGVSPDPTASHTVTRLPDADWHDRRCMRIQIIQDTPAAGPRLESHVIYIWYLLADAHYLPVKMEAHIDNGGKQGMWLTEATDLQELAPGILHPTEDTLTMGDARYGMVTTVTYDHVALHPDLPADKLTNIPIPPGTLLTARKDNKPIARAKTDDHWTLRSAAALLLDPTTTTQPTK